MFDGPEYASYVALCRELRLEHKFEEGDVFVYSTGPAYATEPIVFSKLQPDSTLRVWLPRLDQWLAMLRIAGRQSFELHASTYMEQQFGASDYYVGASWQSSDSHGDTPEEAAARLWMAITGHSSQLTDPVSSS